jgi:hypothetical protein
LFLEYFFIFGEAMGRWARSAPFGVLIYPKRRMRASVADPGCLSRIPDPDFYPSRISDPKTATKERGEKKLVVITFYVATNFTNLQLF